MIKSNCSCIRKFLKVSWISVIFYPPCICKSLFLVTFRNFRLTKLISVQCVTCCMYSAKVCVIKAFTETTDGFSCSHTPLTHILFLSRFALGLLLSLVSFSFRSFFAVFVHVQPSKLHWNKRTWTLKSKKSFCCNFNVTRRDKLNRNLMCLLQCPEWVRRQLCVHLREKDHQVLLRKLMKIGWWKRPREVGRIEIMKLRGMNCWGELFLWGSEFLLIKTWWRVKKCGIRKISIVVKAVVNVFITCSFLPW